MPLSQEPRKPSEPAYKRCTMPILTVRVHIRKPKGMPLALCACRTGLSRQQQLRVGIRQKAFRVESFIDLMLARQPWLWRADLPLPF